MDPSRVHLGSALAPLNRPTRSADSATAKGHRMQSSHAETFPLMPSPPLTLSPPLSHQSLGSSYIHQLLQEEEERRQADHGAEATRELLFFQTETSRRSIIENDSYFAMSAVREAFTRGLAPRRAPASAAASEPATAPASSTVRVLFFSSSEASLAHEASAEKRATAPPSHLVDESTGLLSGRGARRACGPFIAYTRELPALRGEPSCAPDTALDATCGTGRVGVLLALSAVSLTVSMLQSSPIAPTSFGLLDAVDVAASQRPAVGFAVACVDAVGFTVTIVIAALVAPRAFASAPHAALIIGSLGITAATLCALRGAGTGSFAFVIAAQLLHGVSLALLMAALFVLLCAAFSIAVGATALLYVAAPAFLAACTIGLTALRMDTATARLLPFVTWAVPFLSVALWATLPPAACEPTTQALQQYMDRNGFCSTARRIEWSFALRGAACGVFVAFLFLHISLTDAKTSSLVLCAAALGTLTFGLMPPLGTALRVAECGLAAAAAAVAVALGGTEAKAIAETCSGVALAVAVAGAMRSLAAMRSSDVSGVPAFVCVLQCAVGAVWGMGVARWRESAGTLAAEEFLLRIVCVTLGSIAALLQVAAAVLHYSFRST